MRWLEGWLGAVAGGVGLLVAFLSSIVSTRTLDLTDVYISYSSNGHLPVAAQWIRLLVGLPSITMTLLFAGVLCGVWLDLTGQRTRGRVMLLACATLLFLTPFLSTSAATAQVTLLMLQPAIPFAVLALGVGVLACLRRERQPGDAGERMSRDSHDSRD
ncbi:MAG TPA: hypothetical protein VIC27_00250 [Ktedonobacterales bacterium]